jgi:hypothetical protein
MEESKVLTDYSKVRDFELNTFAQVVYTALNPNPNFIWGETAMEQFRAGILAYRAALEKAQDGTKSDRVAKKAARKTLIVILRKVAAEVNRQGAGNLAKLQSSGLRLARVKSRVGVLPKPTGFKVSSGANSGELLCWVDAHPNAVVYNFYFAPAPASAGDWRLIPSTTRKKNIAGFTPQIQYELKCAYQGREENLIFSDSVFIYAQ